MEEGQYEAAQAQVEADFRKEFGAAFDDTMANASGVVNEFGNDDMTEIMLADGTRLGDHPDFIRMNVSIANFINEKIGEDTLEGVKTSNQMMPSDIQAEIAAIDANPAYFQKNHPQQPFLVQERLRLQRNAKRHNRISFEPLPCRKYTRDKPRAPENSKPFVRLRRVATPHNAKVKE